MEILSTWEQWKGPMKEFYRGIGVSAKGMASIIGRAKKMRREGYFPVEEFKEIKLESSSPGSVSNLGPCQGIELNLSGGRLKRNFRCPTLNALKRNFRCPTLNAPLSRGALSFFGCLMKSGLGLLVMNISLSLVL
jgi:hypothetical protein